MPSNDRAIASANQPILGPWVMGLAASVGTTPIVLFADLTTPGSIRRVRVVNTHASQNLALVLVPLGQAPGAQTVADGALIPAGATFSVPIMATQRILIVGSNAATTFNASTSDI